jgi:hypothetical protein
MGVETLQDPCGLDIVYVHPWKTLNLLSNEGQINKSLVASVQPLHPK